MEHRHGYNLSNFFIALCLLFAVFGCADDSDESPSGVRSSSVATIAHWQLLQEYANNEVKANSQYTGNRVTVTGPLDYVSVKNGKMKGRFSVPAVSYTQLFAEFPDSEKSSIATIKSGQQVVVECTCLGITSPGRLEMNDCVLK
jgi:hypothetical protein